MPMRTLCIIIFYFLSCDQTAQKRPLDSTSAKQEALVNNSTQYKTCYDFTTPPKTYILDSKLKEISSLAYDTNKNTFLTNNDEKGHFYELSTEDFSIISDIKFAKKGDYEAIEVFNNTVYIAKNNGTLYKYNIDTEETKKIKTELTAANNLEGLCYLNDENLLLLACKGQTLNLTKGKKNHKAIYAYQLEENKLDTTAYLNIYDEDLISFVNANYKKSSKSTLKNFIHKAKSFAPSAIGIHPKTNNIYIASAKGSTLAIYNKEKSLVHLEFLNSQTNPQPEGLSFDTEANLYISTEGQGFSGKIFKYAYNPNG